MTDKLDISNNGETASVPNIAEEHFQKELNEELRKREGKDFFNKYVGLIKTDIGENYEEELIKAIAEKHRG